MQQPLGLTWLRVLATVLKLMGSGFWSFSCFNLWLGLSKSRKSHTQPLKELVVCFAHNIFKVFKILQPGAADNKLDVS